MDRQELIDYLVEEGSLTEEQATQMSNEELYNDALEWNGIINYGDVIKDWATPMFQEHFSENPEELNISINWIQRKYHELLKAGIIVEVTIKNESEPKPQYPDNVFNP